MSDLDALLAVAETKRGKQVFTGEQVIELIELVRFWEGQAKGEMWAVTNLNGTCND